MIPVKETRTKILLLLFFIPKDDFSFVSFSPNLQKIFDFSLNQKTKRVIGKLVNEGLIEEKTERENSSFPIDVNQKIRAGDESKRLNLDNNQDFANKQLNQVSEIRTSSLSENYYRLTKKGFQSLCLEFPFFRFLKEEWDGLWRVISYEIPEKKREIRDRLRREMRGWGLGPWHRSFWLTPHPIIIDLKNLIYGKEEQKYFQAFESTHVLGDLNVLVEKVWKKSELEKKYRELFKKWHESLSTQKNNEEKLTEIIASYIEILRLDPGLPEGLIGKKWIGLESYNIFKEIKEILLR